MPSTLADQASSEPPRRWQQAILPSLTLLLFLGAAWAIHRELALTPFATAAALRLGLE